jgi:hypothetical protein
MDFNFTFHISALPGGGMDQFSPLWFQNHFFGYKPSFLDENKRILVKKKRKKKIMAPCQTTVGEGGGFD